MPRMEHPRLVRTFASPSSLPGYWRANAGGPMSRRRSIRIASSVFDDDESGLRCSRVLRLGLSFPEDADPVELIEELLLEEGLADPEALRQRFAPPENPCLCQPRSGEEPRLRVAGAPRDEVLEQALLLGLCTGQIYDPGRPVIWTRKSLSRALDLHDARGFYA